MMHGQKNIKVAKRTVCTCGEWEVGRSWSSAYVTAWVISDHSREYKNNV